MLCFFPEHAWNELSEEEKLRMVKNNESSQVYYEVLNLVIKWIDWMLELKRTGNDEDLEELWMRDKEKVIKSARMWYEEYNKASDDPW